MIFYVTYVNYLRYVKVEITSKTSSLSLAGTMSVINLPRYIYGCSVAGVRRVHVATCHQDGMEIVLIILL